MEFGDTITVTRVYERRTRYRTNERFHSDDRVKVWELIEVKPRAAIFLGERTLRNGITSWEDEVGMIFTPDKDGHFRAALVCFSPHENPVYAPLDQCQEEPTHATT